MKERIIGALAFARNFVRGDMEFDSCTHSGNYSPHHPDCQDCERNPECEWLYSNDEFVALQEKSLPALGEALEFALGYVDAQLTHWSHRPRSCPCEVCGWLRSARKLHAKLVAQNWT